VSRRTRRRNDWRRAEQQPPRQVTALPQPVGRADVTTDPTVLALKLILAQLHDDGTGRVMPQLGHLIPLFDAREWGTVAGAIGYLLVQVVDGLRNGYGGTEGAIDAVTAQLAATVLGVQAADGGR
jgi:hypothetical protein